MEEGWMKTSFEAVSSSAVRPVCVGNSVRYGTSMERDGFRGRSGGEGARSALMATWSRKPAATILFRVVIWISFGSLSMNLLASTLPGRLRAIMLRSWE